MDFGLLELKDDSELKNGDNIFVIPKFLSDKRCTVVPLSQQYGTYDGGNSYTDLSGTKRTRSGETIIKMKYSVMDIIGQFDDNKHICTTQPSAAVLKMMRAILATMDVGENTKIFVSEFPIDNSSHIGFDGICFYVGEDVLGVLVDSLFLSTPIPFKKSAIQDFRLLDKKYKHGLPIEKNDYATLIKQTFKKSRADVERRLVGELRSHAQTTKSYANSLKQKKPGYLKYLKAKAVVADYSKTAPKEILEILEVGLRETKKDYANFMEIAKTAKAYSRQYEEKLGIMRFFSKSFDEAGSDFKAVQSLLKQGLIETLVYKQGVGISWIYAPRTYNTGTGIEVFLGRVKVTIQEKMNNGYAFKFEMISYPKDSNTYGTWHFQGKEDHASYCIGDFGKILNNLLLGGKLSNIILVCSDYINSVNLASKHTHPHFDLMSLKDPKVIDDSFEVWKKSKDKEAVVAKTIIGLPEEDDDNQVEEV